MRIARIHMGLAARIRKSRPRIVESWSSSSGGGEGQVMRRVTVPLENTPAATATTTIPDELSNSWCGYDLAERIVRER